MLRPPPVRARIRKDILDSRQIIATLRQLCLRIEDRFPESGLLGVAQTLHTLALETDRTIRWIEKPNYLFRLIGTLIILAVAAGLALVLSRFDFKADFALSDFVTLTEAAINELILLGIGVLFVVSFETRQKRNRVIAALNQLRSVAHVIDAHQLTKDPELFGEWSRPTANSPSRTLDEFHLGRYLDYCTELLALTSKVAFLYVQRFNDPAAESAANDLENLTLGLSSKIWQKIMLLHNAGQLDRDG